MRSAHRTWLAVACAVAVGTTLSACSSDAGSPAEHQVVTYHADYPAYDSADGLYARANLVVRATLASGTGQVRQLHPNYRGTDPRLNPLAGVDSPEATSDADNVVITVYRATVVDVYKGAAAPGQTIEIQQLGGVLDGVTYTEDGPHPLAGGKGYILFLETYPDAPAALLNPLQGQYPIDATGNPANLSGNPVSVTGSDLSRLRDTK